MRPSAVLACALAALLPSCTETYERCADGAVAVSTSPLRCARDASADVAADVAADIAVDACVAEDEPGDGADSNCDGVDGVRGGQIYVSGETGDDAAGNGLSPERPLRTLGAALRLSSMRGSPRTILLGSGDYPFVATGDAGTEVAYTLTGAMRLHGGYTSGWVRRGGESVVRGDLLGLWIRAEATDDVVLTDLTVRGESPASTVGGESVYAIFAQQAQSLRMERVRVVAGRGTAGAAGAPGAEGAVGSMATGVGGAAGCGGANGGNGGNGANSTSPAAEGAMGMRGSDPMDAPGGAGGGLSPDSGTNLGGLPGTPGDPGARGAPGATMDLGVFSVMRGYDAVTAGAGGVGRAGGGGGGGGGGRTAMATGVGGRGGGGGGGGCGGAGGGGGQGGGASVGVFVVGQTRLVMRGGRVEVAGGGDGGSGGAGGGGGVGGGGATGEAGVTAGDGGQGAMGGRGGSGGDGGRGAGGPSLGVLRADSASIDADESVVYEIGPGGNPGAMGAGSLSRALSQRLYVIR